MDDRMKNHPGHTMTIYDLPAIVAQALPLATTPNNIKGGFKVSGVFPFNCDVFEDYKFAPASVTDRPMPPNNEDQLAQEENKSIHSTPTKPLVFTPDAPLLPISKEHVSPKSNKILLPTPKEPVPFQSIEPRPSTSKEVDLYISNVSVPFTSLQVNKDLELDTSGNLLDLSLKQILTRRFNEIAGETCA